jgi:hypothetical protein
VVRKFNAILTTSKEFVLLDYLLFYLLSLLMCGDTLAGSRIYDQNQLKLYLGLEKFLEKMVNRKITSFDEFYRV